MKDVPPHLREKKYLEESLAKLLKKQEAEKQHLARLEGALEEQKRKRDETTLES